MSGFRFEPLSFLIGFITASVLAFILYRLRHRIARVREQAAERAERARRFATRAADARYQLDLVAYCQQYTIAGRRVGLSEVLVEPRFVRGIQPYDASGERRLTDVFRVIPLVHEFPASYAPYNIETIGIADLGAGDRHLALLGIQGSGRSTALAAIALWAMNQIDFAQAQDLVQQSINEEEAKLSDKERAAWRKRQADIQARALEQIKKAQEQAAEAVGQETAQREVIDLRRLMPILVHFNDIVIDPEAQGRLDPAEPLVRAIRRNVRRITALNVPRYIYNRLNAGQALVLLDGLDDLPAERQMEKLAWLRRFMEIYPACMVVVAGPAIGHTPLLHLGFTPIFLRPWNDLTTQSYAQKWAEAWPRVAGTRRRPAPPPDEKIVADVAADTRGLRPLDLTLRILNAYTSGEVTSGRRGWYDDFIRRSFRLKAAEGDEALAQEALRTITQVAAENLISGPLSAARLTEIATAAFRRVEGEGKQQKETFILPVDEFVKALIGPSGLMVGRVGGTYDFRHVLLAACVASNALLDPAGQLTLDQAALDPAWKHAISFGVALAPDHMVNRAVVQKLSQPPDLLFNDLFDLVHWLPDAPANAPWRGEVFKRLAAALIAPSQFPTLRERAMAALVTTRDKNILFILRQAIRTTDPDVRRLGCIGLGCLGEGEAIKDLMPMLEDDDLDVQLAAGLALGAIGSEKALEVMVEGLLNGEEKLRQAVAEALAAIPGEGHQLLHTAIHSEDMMVRRAAVLGLARVQTPWALADMYRALLEDPQWYVRSAAEQAFAEAQSPTHDAAVAHPPVETLEWLADWAAEKGLEAPTSENAHALLGRVLQEGDPAYKIASARTLGILGYPLAARVLYRLLCDENEAVRAAAYAALADLETQFGERLPGTQ